MSRPLVERIPFAKIVAILAIVFLVSLGLCGLNFLLWSGGSQRSAALGPLLAVAGTLELAAIVLSGVGLLLTCVAWGIASAVSGFRRENHEPQPLFEVKDDTKPEDPQ